MCWCRHNDCRRRSGLGRVKDSSRTAERRRIARVRILHWCAIGQPSWHVQYRIAIGVVVADRLEPRSSEVVIVSATERDRRSVARIRRHSTISKIERRRTLHADTRASCSKRQVAGVTGQVHLCNSAGGDRDVRKKKIGKQRILLAIENDFDRLVVAVTGATHWRVVGAHLTC